MMTGPEEQVVIQAEVGAEEVRVFQEAGLHIKRNASLRRLVVIMAAVPLLFLGFQLFTFTSNRQAPLDLQQMLWAVVLMFFGFAAMAVFYLQKRRQRLAEEAGMHAFTAAERGLIMGGGGTEAMLLWGHIRRVEGGGKCLVLVAGPGQVFTFRREKVAEGDFDRFVHAVRRRVAEHKRLLR